MTDTITQVISSGTSDRIEQVVKSVVQHHDKLDHREYPDQHPMEAITGLQEAFNTKQDVIQDLDTIRSGAAAGATALQPSALNGYATEQWVGQQGFLTSTALVGYATEQWVQNQGYLTGIDSSDVINALGYTPYNASNPDGFITSSAISNMQTTTNLVTSLSAQSTDTQYPSAKCMWDIVGDIESTINAIRGV